MVKFRQIIRPGNHGRDVKATKDAMLRMHVDGSGAMGKSGFAGAAWERCIKRVQKNHGLKVDGIYGKGTHAVIAPHFTAFDRWRYRTAKIRHHKKPPPPVSGQAAAKKLAQFHARGVLHDDSGRVISQISAAAMGEPVWSPMGHYVHLDAKMLEALVEILDSGIHIGLFAMCTDHPYDGPHGHAGGKAVDISSVDGTSVSSHSERARLGTLKLAKHLHSNMPSSLLPWQLICDGYGYMHDSEISAQTIPGAAFYGPLTMSEHRNHVHLGYYI
jgi:hypothetical protein